MADGSDAIADWPLLNALVSTASGASWVSIHHGGGVGIGRSIHAGQVTVADGTELAAQKLERVLTNDPAMGVLRHVDAGYPEAERQRATVHLPIPMDVRRPATWIDASTTRRRRLDRSPSTVRPTWADLAGVGRDRVRGGYSRHVFDDAEMQLRQWFTEQAQRRGLGRDRPQRQPLGVVGGPPGPARWSPASHLDSVPGGGAFDGPLGVVSALLAVDELRVRGVEPARPLAIACFAEEEGGRFGLPCLGFPAADRRHRRRPGASPARPRRRLVRRRRPARRPRPVGHGPDPARLASIGAVRRAAHRAGPVLLRRPDSGRSASDRRSSRTAGGGSRSPAGQPRRHHPSGRPPRPDDPGRGRRARRPAGDDQLRRRGGHRGPDHARSRAAPM